MIHVFQYGSRPQVSRLRVNQRSAQEHRYVLRGQVHRNTRPKHGIGGSRHEPYSQGYHLANNTAYGKGYRIRGDQEPGFDYTLTLRR